MPGQRYPDNPLQDLELFLKYPDGIAPLSEFLGEVSEMDDRRVQQHGMRVQEAVASSKES